MQYFHIWRAGGWRSTQQVSEGCGCLCLTEGIHLGSDPWIRKRLKFESALEESWSNPLLKAELPSWLGQLVQGLTQTSSEDLQEWRSLSLWATCLSAQLLFWGIIFFLHVPLKSPLLHHCIFDMNHINLHWEVPLQNKALRSALAREFQDNKIPFSAVCSYLDEWPKEKADKYIQEKRISRWFQTELTIIAFEPAFSI